MIKSLRSQSPIAGPATTPVPLVPVASNRRKRPAEAEVARERESLKKARSDQRPRLPAPPPTPSLAPSGSAPAAGQTPRHPNDHSWIGCDDTLANE